jgi:hypothetical protein
LDGQKDEQILFDGYIKGEHILVLPKAWHRLWAGLDADAVKKQLRRTGYLIAERRLAEVLSAISRSKFELQSILQSVVDTASQLCRADVSVIFRLDGGVYRFAAWRDHPDSGCCLAVYRSTAAVA